MWDNAQQAAFLDATRAERWDILWRLALATGMRWGELCALTWAEVDLDRARLRVPGRRRRSGAT